MEWIRRALRRRREQGAVAVEAALVTLPLCLLVFGMIDFAFVMKDYAGVASMTRLGARIASTGAGDGPCKVPVLPTDPPCTPLAEPAMAQLAADAMQNSGAMDQPDNINYILIFKANAKGFPKKNAADESVTSMPSDCTGYYSCIKFTWNPVANKFRYSIAGSAGWNSSNISACFPGTASTPLDRVGIHIDTDHQMMSGLFGTTIPLNDTAVMDFEPLPTQSCNGKGVTNGGHA